ncbi:restriction endonuclease subunit S [Marinoscillum sp.]|uniref:restriction endonuclease subunit S n=1 Tax=Marinoscillum sp. TaxID=2024838 RepID=UPI003BA96583
MEIIQQNTFEKYPVYKDSGICDIGDLPDNWKLNRFRNLFSFSKGLNITKENLQEDGIPCVNYGEIHSKYGFEVNPEINVLKCVDEDYLLDSPKSLLKYGDFVFADTSEDIEGSGNFTYLNSNTRTFAGYHTVIARLKKTDIDHRFLAYQIDSKSFRDQIRKAVKGVKVYSITNGILKNTTLWFPPLPEQTAIAHFLDEKTAKIDQAIAQKEQLITLLKERKQIMIQELVTGKKVWNGTTWAAPEKTKDSGIDWIGKIPVGWEVKTNNLLFQERKEPGQEGLPLLSVSIHTAVSSEEIDSTDNIQGRIKIEDKSKYKFVKSGDIVFNMMRAWQGAIGAVRVDGMVSPAYVVAKPLADFNSDFLEFQYRTPDYIQQIDRFSKGITDFRKRLYWDEFKQLNVILPSREIQDLISDFIHSESSKIDQSISFQEQQIEKLREYKATLIDSAVTGKVMV